MAKASFKRLTLRMAVARLRGHAWERCQQGVRLTCLARDCVSKARGAMDVLSCIIKPALELQEIRNERTRRRVAAGPKP